MKCVPEVSEFNMTRQGFWRVGVSQIVLCVFGFTVEHTKGGGKEEGSPR